MNTTCLYLSEARSMVPPSTYPRLHSLRSLSLGLLRTSLSEAVSHYCTWMDGIRVILRPVTLSSLGMQLLVIILCLQAFS